MVKTFGFSPRGSEDGNDDRGYDHDASKHYEAHREEQFLKLSYLTDRIFRGSIESNDNRAEL